MAWLYLVPSMKTWPTSIPLVVFRIAVLPWRGIAGPRVAQIRELLHVKIARPVDVDQMRIEVVPADDDVCARLDGMIGDNA